MYIPKDVIIDLELLEKKTHSLLNLVNHTKTRFGLIKLKNNIVQPFANEEKIKQRQDNILFFNENESLAMKIENVLKDIPFTLNILSEDFNTERKTLESLKKVFEDSKKLNKFILRVFELKDLLHSDLQLFKNFNESVINSKIIEIRDEFAKVFEFNEESFIKQSIDDYLDLARKIHNVLYEDALKITEKLLVDKRF
ncbi:DNA mismatch repair protein msh-2 [Nosema bombycis CQ1]|uniref:DNA mismatch repair protein msh-2 n=1 Tax=Nosema bombycis (strain CQ1 / CVCC 102059) TaxID=578461 RepID=R0MGP8_NOSB1|nr:DNA mismatch repair protein msh-2 [Nosema bombycis CQ1]|eukprot:EOB11923.1 DNA mismatch repair protein msh-2 [Nosema bombycis CQ1]